MPQASPRAPSRTSILVATARALGARDPDHGVRNPDFLAEAFIGPEERSLIAEHPISKALDMPYEDALYDIPIAMLTSMMIFRTRFIDHALERAVADGATQVVFLGAGFDTRAYRFATLLRACRVIEIDAPHTQEYKKRRVVAALGSLPENVTYLPVDFAAEHLADVLESCGLRKDEKSFFIWEGVSMYLPEQSIRSVLTSVARHAAPGSSLVLDYANRIGLEMMLNTQQGPAGSAASWGEPWIFGVPGTNGGDFFREHGFDPGTPVSTTDEAAIKRYAVRSDGKTYAAETMERMRCEAMARYQAAPTSPESVAMVVSWKAITEAGGFYWLAELKVPSSQPSLDS